MDSAGFGLRRLTGLLVVLNMGVLLAGLGISYWPSQPVNTLEFNGDKVIFQRVPEVSGTASTVVVNSNKAMISNVTKPVAAPEPSEKLKPPATCLSWRSLDADSLLTVESRLKQAGMAPGSYELQLSKRLGWWVYLPPFADSDAVRAAMEEARGKGVTDMAPVRGGKMANALSLGAFPTLENARAHASSLAGKGIKGVKLGPRPEAGEVRMLIAGAGPAAPMESLLMDWPKGLQPSLCEPDKP